MGMGITGQALKGVPLSPSRLAQQAKLKRFSPVPVEGEMQERAEGPDTEVHYELRQQPDNENF